MKRSVIRMVAVLAAITMMLSLCGCEELLEYALADYAMDDSAYSDYYDFGSGTGTGTETTTGNNYYTSGYGGYGYQDYSDLFSEILSEYYGSSYGSDYSSNYSSNYGSDYSSDYGSGYGSTEDSSDYSSYYGTTGNSDYDDYMQYFTELFSQMYGSDYSSYGSSSTSGGGYGTGSSQSAVTVSDNILGEAVRDQFTEIKGNGEDVITVMVYMCASNLESESGLATEDLKEMMKATENSNLNIIVETGGCSKWYTSGISSQVNQRHIIRNGKINTIESNLGRKIMTEADTLTDFITYCAENFPANRNMLILWDHGGGAVEGYGYDEYGGYDTMTLDELGNALYNANVKFDMIGFDACLMSTLEVACVLYDFADYMIASEDYESGYGWEYKPWLSILAQDTSTTIPQLAKTICDDYITESGSSAAILGCFDLSYMKLVYTTWRDFAYAAADQLLDDNFSWETQNNGGRISMEDLTSLFSTESDIQDMVAIANSVENVEEADALISALGNCTIYCSANAQDAHMTGMAVTLPYGDKTTYNSIKEIFPKAGFEDEYIEFLGRFANKGGSASTYDWSDWYDMWNGWSDPYSTGGSNSYDSYDWSDWSGWNQYNNNDNYWYGYDGSNYGSTYGYGNSNDYGSYGYGGNGGFGSNYSNYSDYDDNYGDYYDDIWSYIFGY